MTEPLRESFPPVLCGLRGLEGKQMWWLCCGTSPFSYLFLPPKRYQPALKKCPPTPADPR